MTQILFVLLALLSLTPWVSSGMALFAGLAFALLFGTPFAERTSKHTSRLLAISVVGLGGSMNLQTVGSVGLQGLSYTAVGILLTFVVGLTLGKMFKVDSAISMLITVGTAICGGSAIAAVAPAIRARSHEITVSLATVFILNACALFLFPPIGEFFKLTQHQFGLWAALAIHDTSSVVGAGLQFGQEALKIATTTKLARALWIFPVTFAVGYFYSSSIDETKKGKKPWFILGFILVSAVVTWLPFLQPAGDVISTVAKRFLVLTLFLIGSNLSKDKIKEVGFRPFLQGVTLWLIVASVTLSLIVINVIS